MQAVFLNEVTDSSQQLAGFCISIDVYAKTKRNIL